MTGTLIRQAREAEGLTQAALARRLGITQPSIARLEAAGDEVTPEILHERGLIKKAKHDLVILGNGDVSKELKISAHRFTKAAREKIEKAGGSATEIVKAAAAGA